MQKYIPVKMHFDYCIQDEEINRKGFSDKLCENMKKDDAIFICKAVNNYDSLLSSAKELLSAAKESFYKDGSGKSILQEAIWKHEDLITKL